MRLGRKKKEIDQFSEKLEQALDGTGDRSRDFRGRRNG